MFKPIEGKRLSQTVAILTADGSLGDRGSVLDALPGMVESTGARVIYAAARRSTLRSIAEFCMELQIPSQMAVEEHMACGIGLCFTCTVPVIRKDGSGYENARACTDGPVFNPARILWDRWMGDEPPSGADAARGLPGGADVAGVTHALGVDLGGLRFAHPVLAASGCLGTGRDVPGGLVDLHKLGGAVTPSLTMQPSRGAPTPRAAETPSGFLWSLGMQNPGVEAFCAEDLPRLVKSGLPVIASVAGSSLEEYIRVTSGLHGREGIVALEVCLSGPDEERDGDPVYARPERIIEIVGAVARLSRLPVFAKLPPLLPDLVETARSCVRAGAHGLTLIDSVPGLAVDAERLRPRLAAPVGGLSGPAIKPIALAAVYRVASAMPEVPDDGRRGDRHRRRRGRVPPRGRLGRSGGNRAARRIPRRRSRSRAGSSRT